MSSSDDLDRYRYLQLKMKMASADGGEGTPPQSLFEKAKALATPQNISGVARPILQGTGMTLGGLAGASGGPTAPFTIPAGGALGYAAGNEAANLLDRGLGLAQPLKNMTEAAKSTADSVYQGAQAETIGMVANKGIQAAGKYIAKPIMATMAGIDPSEYKILAEKPGNILPESMKNATTELNVAKSKAGIVDTANDAINRALREDKPFVQSIHEKIMAGVPVTQKEAFEANQAVNSLLQNETNKDARRGLTLLKERLGEILSKEPSLPPAMQAYGEAKAGEKFRNVLPLTKQGKPAVLRTLAMLSRVIGPQAFLSSPALQAGPVMAAGVANRVMQSPLHRLIVPPLLQALSQLKVPE